MSRRFLLFLAGTLSALVLVTGGAAALRLAGGRDLPSLSRASSADDGSGDGPTDSDPQPHARGRHERTDDDAPARHEWPSAGRHHGRHGGRAEAHHG